MASGGGLHKVPMSEPRSRSLLYRLTNSVDDDHSSNGSARQEDRPNNWDFSDWQPSAAFDAVRMRIREKRTNPEKEQEKKGSREGGQSLSQDSTPRGERKKHTPATFPRTKFTPITTLSDRVALETLRQNMTFSDVEDHTSVDGERNNERYIPPRRDRHTSLNSLEHTDVVNDVGAPDGAIGNSLRNPNVNQDETSDSKIVGRLMQIRDYIKQASSMMDWLQSSPDHNDQNRASQLEQVIARLKEQEHKYLELMLKYAATGNEGPNGPTLPNGLESNNNSRPQSSSDMGSQELDVQSDSSEATMSDLAQKNHEMEALAQLNELLKKKIQLEEQVGALQERQATVLSLQQEVENRLATSINQADRDASENTSSSSTVTNSVSAVEPQASVQQPKPKDQFQQLPQQSSQDDSQGSEHSLMSVELHQLENKLEDLQQKKQHMEDLLQDLQRHRRQVYGALANEGAAQSEQKLDECAAQAAAANATASDAQKMIDVLDTRKKLIKLQEVKERLNQLRELVHYYRSGTKFIHQAGEPPEPPSIMSFSDYEDPAIMRNLREMQSRGSVQQRLEQYARGNGAVGAKEPRAMAQESSSETESQVSSQDAWADDPDIMEKVRKLKAAKEKLKKLQELVSMVQQSPEAARCLPSDLAELAASLEGEVMSQLSQNPHLSELAGGSMAPSSGARATGFEASGIQDGEVDEQQQERDERFYESKMKEQREELEQLMEERQQLLALHSRLQHLTQQIPQDVQGTRNMQVQTSHDSLVDKEHKIGKQAEEAEAEEQEDVPEPSVTFQEPIATVASNDEIYGRMRQQRILREELRDKKKALEDMMRKDRPHKQYSRNRDKESDNVSLSNKSDQFGTSVVSGDVTMATWGGSTVDNLESIEEEDNASGAGQEPDEEVDDGYPSDGIVQVEEEEEANADSEDGDTYTIEEEYRAKGRRTKVKLPVIDGPSTRSRRRKRTTRRAPLLEAEERQRGYNIWSPDSRTRGQRSRKTQWHRQAPGGNRRNRHSRQEAYEDVDGSETRGLREELHMMRMQMESTTALCQTLAQMVNHNSTADYPGGGPGMMYGVTGQAPVVQGLSRCCQQMANTQAYLQQVLLQMGNSGAGDNNQGAHPAGPVSPMNLNSMQAHLQTAPLLHQTPSNFTLNPQFPSTFAAQNNPSVYSAANISTSLVNNLQVPDMSKSNKSGMRTQTMLNNQLGQPIRNKHSQAQPITRQDSASSLPGSLNQEGQDEEIPIVEVRASDMNRENNVPGLNLTDFHRQRHKKSRGLKADSHIEEVIGQKFPTPSRAEAIARLADQKVRDNSFRPGLSAGISGTAFMDGASCSSRTSSVPGSEGRAASEPRSGRTKQSKNTRESDGDADMSLFEAMRGAIYSEVGALISLNEDRPHFLTELFRDLQLLNTDYLRQRALYAIRDLIAKQLTEESLHGPNRAPPPLWLRGVGQNGNEQTPSESLITSEDEDMPPPLYSESNPAQTSHASCPNTAGLDYAEIVENASSQSTPSSGGYFAQDSLGDTVIHFEEALQRMREQEQTAEGDDDDQADNSTATTESTPPTARRVGSVQDYTRMYELTATSSQDQASEGSVSDVPETWSLDEILKLRTTLHKQKLYPRINTQQLDQQIKAIMKEVIPVVKEHMDDVCSQQLLQYVKRLVLALSSQRHSEQHEFTRFFHKQLGSILQDSLSKFEGRKMRECGEDLIVDVSEILFNELAFFRLMQDLDDAKLKAGSGFRGWRQESATSTDNSAAEERLPGYQQEEQVERDGGQSSVESSASDGEQSQQDIQAAKAGEGLTLASQASEVEDLGKARDDELAEQVEVADKDYDSDGQNNSELKIELSVCETKPYTRIGSDEDDGASEDIDEEDAADLSETAVSRSACDVDKLDEAETASVEQQGEVDSAVTAAADSKEQEAELDEEEKDKDTALSTEETSQSSTAPGAPPESSQPEKINEGEITVDDLPAKLDVDPKETSPCTETQAAESAQDSCEQGASPQVDDKEGGDKSSPSEDSK